MTISIREILPQPLWTSGLAFATIAFGLGQTVGPSLTGWVSDRSQDLGTGLLLSAALLLAGAGLALLQQRELAQGAQAGASAPPPIE